MRTPPSARPCTRGAGDPYQLGRGLRRLVRSENRFSDENRVHTGLSESTDIRTGSDTALGYDEHIRGDRREQPFRRGQIGREMGEITVVDPDDARVDP